LKKGFQTPDSHGVLKNMSSNAMAVVPYKIGPKLVEKADEDS
jgi:hypothetical protein